MSSFKNFFRNRTPKKEPSIPHYDLAPMKKIDLSRFSEAKRDSLEALIISMAIAYNDCKDMMWMSEMLDSHTPPNKTAIAEVPGQWRAMKNYTFKIITAHIHEIILLIGANKKIIESPRFRVLESKLRPELKEYWSALRDTALEYTGPQSPLKKKLEKVRSKIVFHYDSNDNLNKLKESIRINGNDGYISVGDTLEQTRFYFADKAFDAYRKEMAFDDNEANELFSAVSIPIRFLIEEFIKSKI